MARTPDQIAADDALTAAIEAVQHAYHVAPAGVFTGYVVLTAHQGIEDDGAGNTSFNWLCKDDGMPWHHIYGILDMGRYVIDETRAQSFREPS